MAMLDVQKRVYDVGWGGRRKALAIPEDNIVAELKMTDFPPVPNVADAIVDALERPIGTRPLSEQLRPRSKVALLTGDRITDVMLGTRDQVGLKLLDHLNRLGIRDEDVTLIHAGGSHPNANWRERLGAPLLSRVKSFRHDPRAEAHLTYLGVTDRCTPVWVNSTVVEADFRLAIGEISPTVHGGWCGGGKIILPGVAGMDSIEQNHSFMIRPVNTLGLVDSNHMRLDMEEGARLAGLEMKVDVLVNSQGQVVDVSAGDFVAEHRAALPKAREIWMTRLDPVDIIVIYPGESFEEYLCWSLWIRLEGADLALKDDGIIILALSAAGGWAPADRIEDEQATTADLMKLSTAELARLVARKRGNMRNVSMNYSARRVLEKRRVFLVSDGISSEEARAFGFALGTTSFDEALAIALAERGKGASIATNIQHGIAWRTMPWREG